MLTRKHCLCPFHEHSFYDSPHLCWGGAILGNKLFGAVKKDDPCIIDVANFCKYDLRNKIIQNRNSIIITNDVPYGVINSNHKDADYIEEDPIAMADNCDPGTTNTCKPANAAGVLVYNAFVPPINFINCPTGLPTIFFVHGGGLSECSFRPDNVNQNLGVLLGELACRGFICINIEYRRGREVEYMNKEQLEQYTTVQQQLTGYRQAQDINAAIRYVIKRQITGEETAFKIDLNNLFMAGNSGGSFGLFNAYFYQTQNDINQVFASANSVSIVNALGLLKNANYAVDPLDPNYDLYDYHTRIKGILNLWGGFPVPPTIDTYDEFVAYINNKNIIVPPVISFVGEHDDVFPPMGKDIYFSPGPPIGNSTHYKYNLSNYYLTSGSKYQDCTNGNVQYQLEKSGNTIDLHMLGAEEIYNFLKAYGVRTELYKDCQAEHGLDKGTPFLSDYGTGSTTAEQVYGYAAIRTACFFQPSVVGNYTPFSGKTLFIECVNNRSRTADELTCDLTERPGENCCDKCLETKGTGKCQDKP